MKSRSFRFEKVRNRYRVVKGGNQRRLALEKLDERIVFSIDLEARVCFASESSELIASVSHDEPKENVQSEHYHDDGYLRRDSAGLYYYHDPLPVDILNDVGKVDEEEGRSLKSSPDSPNESVPIYHSRPGATRKIFLDFDGHDVTNSSWNNRVYHNGYNTGSVITAVPFSMDSDRSTFSASELSRIREIWARVSEDFAPFDVDVTTEDPGVQLFQAGNQGIRALISTDIDGVTGQQWFPTAGGVAYLNSWTFTSDTPVWVFSNRLGNGEKNIAEATSHEVGHALNLSHDGRSNPSEGYYYGHGSGVEAWAPIMGVGYNRALVQWSKGEYTAANQLEDDLAIIAQKIPYIADDHGNSASNSTQLIPSSTGAIDASGLIATRIDVDAFSFLTQSGQISLSASGFETADGKANLDIGLRLLDESGVELASAAPLNDLNAQVAVTVEKGLYTVIVDGVGREAVSGHEGYSDYASIGRYALTGQLVPNNAPVAFDDASVTGKGRSALIDVISNDSDAELDELAIESITQPSHGSVQIVNNQTLYTPNSNFVGIDTYTYTIVDGFGGADSAVVTVEVVAPAQVAAVVINNDQTQRSSLNELTVEFDSQVEIQEGAISVAKQGDGGEVEITVETSLVGGRTVASVQFAGSLMQGGSLVDGNYLLSIDSAKVIDLQGSQLDGNSDGDEGGNFSFGATEADAFFRYFGDIDGDRSVGTLDYLALRSGYGKRQGELGFVQELDFNDDGAIGVTDFREFRLRFGSTLDFA